MNAVLDGPHTGPTFGELVRRAVRRYADRVAIVCAGQGITYREMGQRISQLMQALRDQGVGRGTGLCLYALNRPEAFYIRVAANLLGARFTAMHPLGSAGDPIYIIKDSQSDFLVVDNALAGRAATMLENHPGLCRVLGLGPTDLGPDLLALADRLAPVPLWCDAGHDDISGLTYTGGTTGQPKGIIHSHRTLVTNVLMCLAEWEWPREIRLIVVTPLSHATGLLMVPSFVRGGTVYLHEGFDRDAFLDSVERDRITTVFLVPTMIYALLDHPRIRRTDLSSLKLIIYGASPISGARLRDALEIFGPVLMQLYAQSEAPMTVTTLNSWDHDPSRPARLGSCGYPMTGVQVRLLDDDGREVPEGEVGEICVRGPLVMDGYWNKPEETRAAFRHGWLHTGDMARRDSDGFLHIVDRKKDMIISGGFNIYPKEVEDVLAEHPAIAAAAVISVPDEKWGEAVKAAVVLKPGARASAEALMAFVRDRRGPVLAPKSVEFLDVLPLTPLGKPDKKSLRARYWTGTARNVH